MYAFMSPGCMYANVVMYEYVKLGFNFDFACMLAIVLPCNI